MRTPQLIVFGVCTVIGVTVAVALLVAYVRLLPGLYRHAVEAWGPRKTRWLFATGVGGGALAGSLLAYYLWQWSLHYVWSLS